MLASPFFFLGVFRELLDIGSYLFDRDFLTGSGALPFRNRSFTFSIPHHKLAPALHTAVLTPHNITNGAITASCTASIPFSLDTDSTLHGGGVIALTGDVEIFFISGVAGFGVKSNVVGFGEKVRLGLGVGVGEGEGIG